MSRAYVPYDLYPDFEVEKGCSVSASIRLRALFFDRCVIAADVLANDSRILEGIEHNAELCRRGAVEIATYDHNAKLADHTAIKLAPDIQARLSRIEGIGFRRFDYDPHKTSREFRSMITNALSREASFLHEEDSLRRLEYVIENIGAHNGMLSLHDALRLTSPCGKRFSLVVRRIYTNVGSKLVGAAPVLPTSMHEPLRQSDSSGGLKIVLCEYMHEALLSLFSIRRDVLETISDENFAAFARSREARRFSGKLLRLSDTYRLSPSTKNDFEHLEDETSCARRSLMAFIAKEILSERQRKRVAEWADDGAMEAIGAVVPMAGTMRKVGKVAFKALSKKVGLEVTVPSVQPLEEYVGGLQKAHLKSYSVD